jgi:hypothetical protein
MLGPGRNQNVDVILSRDRHHPHAAIGAEIIEPLVLLRLRVT